MITALSLLSIHLTVLRSHNDYQLDWPIIENKTRVLSAKELVEPILHSHWLAVHSTLKSGSQLAALHFVNHQVVYLFVYCSTLSKHHLAQTESSLLSDLFFSKFLGPDRIHVTQFEMLAPVIAQS